MTVWKVIDAGAPRFFIAGACAVAFYNQDRETRSVPAETTVVDGMKFTPCPHKECP